MKQLLTIALLSVLFVNCKKKDDTDDQSASGSNFTSIRQFDVDAVHLGNLGNATDDYTQEEWPPAVYSLFAPMDTADLTGYESSEINVQALYPNPVADTQALKIFATKPANLKVVIVDVNRTVFFSGSYHVFVGVHNIPFNYITSGLTPGTFYRMFYGFSAEGKPFFLRGHIDLYKN